MLPYNKKILQIYRQVKNLAQGGNENVYQYFTYIDELIDNSDYVAFEDVMSRYYNFDISRIKPVSLVKNETWVVIRIGTNSSLQESMKDLYQTKGVYQQGLDFYLSSDNTLLGQIGEFDAIVDDGKQYYYLNPEYSEAVKIVQNPDPLLPVKITGLNVITNFPGPTNSFTVAHNLSNLDYNSNLLYNYGIAIDLLISLS